MSDKERWCRPRLVKRTRPDRPARAGELRLVVTPAMPPRSARLAAEEQELRDLIRSLGERDRRHNHRVGTAPDDGDLPPAA